MIKISSSTFISLFTKLLILLVIAKGVSLLLLWFLPSDGVELNTKNNYQPKYQRVDFKNIISKAQAVTANENQQQITGSNVNIKNIVLKGLYGANNIGFIIVAMKSNIKTTTIVEVGESFEGYILKSISVASALLEKNGADFILNLEDIKSTEDIINKKEADSSESTENIVKREDVAYYAKNPKQIWKDISISEIKDGDNIKGFKVTKINKDSKFAALGLKSGDVIIKANNVTLRSYQDVLGIYENIDKLDAVQIVLMRNNKEMEFVYEIN